MRRRIYTVRMPLDAAVNPWIDIPIESPGSPSAPVTTGVGGNGFYAEWRGRPLRVPVKAGQVATPAAGFVPLCALGFDLSIERVNGVGSLEQNLLTTQWYVQGGEVNVGAGARLVIPVPVTGATAYLSDLHYDVNITVLDATNPDAYEYGEGARQTTLPSAPAAYVTGSLQRAADGTRSVVITNNDTVPHDINWALTATEILGAPGAVPRALLSRSLVGNVLTSGDPITTTAGDGAFTDPGDVPVIRLMNGDDVSGALFRVHFNVAEAKDEDNHHGSM